MRLPVSRACPSSPMVEALCDAAWRRSRWCGAPCLHAGSRPKQQGETPGGRAQLAGPLPAVQREAGHRVFKLSPPLLGRCEEPVSPSLAPLAVVFPPCLARGSLYVARSWEVTRSWPTSGQVVNSHPHMAQCQSLGTRGVSGQRERSSSVFRFVLH